MPRRLLLALLLLVATPMALLGWMSAGAVKTNQAESRENLRDLLSAQLYDADHRIVELFEAYAVALEREIDSVRPQTEDLPDTLRRLRRETPIVRQGIIVDPRGAVLFPTPDDSIGIDAAIVAASLPGMIDARPFPSKAGILPASDDHPLEEQEGLRQEIRMGAATVKGTPDLNVKGIPQVSTPQTYTRASKAPAKFASEPQSAAPKVALRDASAANLRASSGSRAAGDSSADEPLFIEPFPSEPPAEEGVFIDSAWQQWYMADGAQVVYWSWREDGFAVGILLERSRWMADLIAVLPDDPSQAGMMADSKTAIGLKSGAAKQPTRSGSVVLVDESKRTIYRWGNPFDFQKPALVVSDLTAPLASWQLRLHVDESLIPTYSPVPMYLSLGGIAFVLLAVGGYVLTSVQRQIADAKSRVNFAGQVSHELRTPLTNIRLYTELAESDIRRHGGGETMQPLLKRLQVIDHESRRLQRLVSGVLEMIRPSGNRVGIRLEPVGLCELIAGIADQFRPSFDASGLQMIRQCDVEQSVMIDADIVEMVLVNLISNVEKYVPREGTCWIRCQIDSSADPVLKIWVSDDGPGIGVIHRTKVFRAFQRLDDSISAPSGTGIGLTIARRAARRHGGELELLGKPLHGGATFLLTVPLRGDEHDGD